ncbi:RNA-directed DNA polymerase (Reverse transcriptase), partial [Trifolium medium]|nr:RNA-directed DNA polymerase (Reverse transcriptase) [Trifolium medium]
MQRLGLKLKHLKGELKVWNKVVFGDIHNQVRSAVNKLDEIQANINVDGYSDHLFNQEKLAKLELERALNMEEAFWQEKSRVKWHCEGDRNTAFFHRTAQIKQSCKNISSIRVDDVILNEPDHIASHVVNHFTTLFSDNNNNVHDNGLIEEVIPSIVSEEINNLLTMIPSRLEIENAVFSMNKEGAPGPAALEPFSFKLTGRLFKMMSLMQFWSFLTPI